MKRILFVVAIILMAVFALSACTAGPQGPAGAQGAEGPQGPKGEPGADGEDADPAKVANIVFATMTAEATKPTATPAPTATLSAAEQALVEVRALATQMALGHPATPQAAAPQVYATPLHAVRLTSGATVIPAWGYGPWGVNNFRYPKVQPNGSIPFGPSQLDSDFDGRNWADSGSWTYKLPAGAKEVWVTIQGDAPGQVSWSGKTLTLTTNTQVTSKAALAKDNAPMPNAGSTGISAVVLVK